MTGLCFRAALCHCPVCVQSVSLLFSWESSVHPGSAAPQPSQSSRSPGLHHCPEISALPTVPHSALTHPLKNSHHSQVLGWGAGVSSRGALCKIRKPFEARNQAPLPLMLVSQTYHGESLSLWFLARSWLLCVYLFIQQLSIVYLLCTPVLSAGRTQSRFL